MKWLDYAALETKNTSILQIIFNQIIYFYIPPVHLSHLKVLNIVLAFLHDQLLGDGALKRTPWTSLKRGNHAMTEWRRINK